MSPATRRTRGGLEEPYPVPHHIPRKRGVGDREVGGDSDEDGDEMREDEEVVLTFLFFDALCRTDQYDFGAAELIYTCEYEIPAKTTLGMRFYYNDYGYDLIIKFIFICVFRFRE